MKQLLMATGLRQGKQPRGEGLHAASAGTQTLATGTKARGALGVAGATRPLWQYRLSEAVR